MNSSINAFIEFLIKHKALQFGEFTLKSGRISPYFFNLGVFHTGSTISKLGEFYAQTLLDSSFNCDVLYGPAYKGIPLASATCIALFNKFNRDLPYCFNRKEKKAHGDQGSFVGAKLKGNVVMLDDVITAGTTVKETLALFDGLEANLSGIVIAFDRQERGDNALSAVQETAQKYQVPVQSIVTLSDVTQYLSAQKTFDTELKAIREYQEKYGV